MFGGMMMAGVNPAVLAWSAQTTGTIRPGDYGAQVGDLLFAIGANSGGFPVIATPGHVAGTFSGGDADAGPNGGGSPWTMIGLRACTGWQGRGGPFSKHPRHAGLVILASGSATSGFTSSLSVDGEGVPRAAGYYSAPSLENVQQDIYLRLQPKWPTYRDNGSISIAMSGSGGSAAIYELLGA